VAPFGIGKSSAGSGGVRQSGSEALQLVLDYVKQETLTPLKGLGRYLLFGIAGSLALCAGLVLLLVALLRALQSETGTTFSGDLSWLPYVIVCAAAMMVMGLAAWRITKGPAARRRREPSTKGGGKSQ
jgi:peptidoglycan biosynthesis protein MviN/MurJ (putative lipid II flippase)